MGQLHECGAFHDKGIGTTPGEGFKKIRVHLASEVKHDSCHAAKLRTNGNLTKAPMDSACSGVVSLKSLRTVMFLAELNGLESWATDIGNARLEAETLEKVFVVAGPESGELEGHALLIFKALRGLRTSGLRWSEKFLLCLKDAGFVPSLADPCTWMGQVDDHWERVAVCADDLAIASKDPAGVVRALTDDCKFKLKGAGPSSSIWDPASFMRKKVSHALHLASTPTSSSHRMNARLDRSQRQPGSQNRWRKGVTLRPMILHSLRKGECSSISQ